jgi:acyl-CoA thioester hydrolase
MGSRVHRDVDGQTAFAKLLPMLDSLIPTPYVSKSQSVLADWIDFNGHMNVAYYLKAFDQGFDEAYDRGGLAIEQLKQTNGSTFVAELHLTYQQEVMEGDPLRITTQLVAFDAKRMHWFQSMYHGRAGYLSATAEWLILYVDLSLRKVATMPDDLQRRLSAIREAHFQLPTPPEVGRRIDITNRRPKN